MKIRRLGLILLAMSCMFGCSSNTSEQEDEVLDVLDDHVITLYGKEYTTQKVTKTYLFTGIDHSGNEDSEEDYSGKMADFMLLLIVNQTDKTYSYLQLNRDTMTTVYEMTEDSIKVYDNVQLCTAHSLGNNKEQSEKITVNTVESLLGDVSIDGYYTLPMDYIGTINHSVGGVTLTVNGDLTNADPELKDGTTLTLSDDQAYIYCSRRMDVDDGENTSRMERQRQYMNALSSMALQKVKDDQSFVNDLFDELSDVARTNMNDNTVSKLMNVVGLTKVSRGDSEIFRGQL